MSKLWCKLGRHKLYRIGRLSSDSEQIGCRRCNRLWGMNHSVRAFLPWSLDLQSMYESFGKSFQDDGRLRAHSALNNVPSNTKDPVSRD